MLFLHDIGARRFHVVKQDAAIAEGNPRCIVS